VTGVQTCALPICNLAVGLGNAPGCPEILESLKERKKGSSPLLEEHISWAIDEQIRKLSS